MTESIRQILARESAGGEVSVRGWVRTARHSKGVSFLEITDGSCFAGMQVVVEPELPNFESEVRRLRTGCAVAVTGTLVESPGKGQRFELKAGSVEAVGNVEDDYPLQKKRHSFEFLRTIAHLRPRTNTIGAVLRVRNAVSRAIHDFFQKRGFILLQTPVITGSDAEGAGDLFRVSVLDAANPPRDEADRVDFSREFFARDTDLAEEFLKEVFAAVLESCPDDMAFFDEQIDDTVHFPARDPVSGPAAPYSKKIGLDQAAPPSC
jgi:asparaginyl-tRNA synthetase